MKLQDIYNHLDKISPFELQEKWDNSGLIIGDLDREIGDIVVSLDVDMDMVEKAGDNTLFVVHHPLIFSGLKSIDFALYPSNIIEKMIQKSQSLVAMHTNFDKTHLNRYVFGEVLGFKGECDEEFVCRSAGEWSGDELIKLLKEKLGMDSIRVVNKKAKIKTIALTTGSGCSLMDDVGVDCFLTGDIKYHDAMKAYSQNLMMVDIGHYESEHYFGKIMQRELEDLGISAIIMQSINPFTTQI